MGGPRDQIGVIQVQLGVFVHGARLEILVLCGDFLRLQCVLSKPARTACKPTQTPKHKVMKWLH